MLRLPDLLEQVTLGDPQLLATQVAGVALGSRRLDQALLAADVLTTGKCRLVQGGAGDAAADAFLLERLVPGKLPPWLHFCSQALAKGKSCVLVTVCGVTGELPYALGDHFAYDERNHGLLPMDGEHSLLLQRACVATRSAGVPARVPLALAGGTLELLLEPLVPTGVPAVILAAGASRRLGSPKQWVERAGESLLRRIARTALAGGGPVTVVTGYRAAEMAAHVADLPVQVLENPQWQEGMAASLRAGVAALPPGSSGVLLLVCDQPGVDPALLARLQAAHRADPQALVACGYGGTRGIPALIPAHVFPKLLELRGDQGARGLLQGDGVVVVPFPAGAEDVDRPEDL